MNFFLDSIQTRSYWAYALFSREALGKLFAVIGVLYLFVEILDFFQVYTRDKYSNYAIFFILVLAVIFVLYTRRPVSRVTYKIPRRDFGLEVRIGDLLDAAGGIVISSNTTFDTDIASGLISPQSLQGQLALRYFQGNTAEIDRQLDASLNGQPSMPYENGLGKKRKYPIGTVAKVRSHGKTFYFIAMAELNEHGNAQSSVKEYIACAASGPLHNRGRKY